MHPRAAGLDVHKMQITASVRLCQPGGGVQCATRQFSALPDGLAELTQWLQSHHVTAAAMEATGIFWQAPWEALEAAGIAPQLLHAQFAGAGPQERHGRQRLAARICQFGPSSAWGLRLQCVWDRPTRPTPGARLFTPAGGFAWQALESG